MRWTRCFKWLWVLAALLPASPAPAAPPTETITVAAASDLQFALREIADDFQRQTGHGVRLVFGSSGNLYAQVLQGAPYDLFFSADQRYPQLLVESGRGEPDSLCIYGVGRLVLWLPGRSPLDPDRLQMEALRRREVRRIAIANPRHAPYGRAAVEALQHYGLYAEVKGKLVLGEQVSQAAQFVETGNADAGLIALSLALAPTMQGRGRYWLVPQEAHTPLIQAAVVPQGARQARRARQFLDHVLSPAGRAVLQRYGFTPPEKP